MSEAQQYEYKAVIGWKVRPGLEGGINNMAAQGWRLVTVCNLGEGEGVGFFYEREVVFVEVGQEEQTTDESPAALRARRGVSAKLKTFDAVVEAMGKND